MSKTWMIRGKEFSNCNCAHGCPCQFNSPSTNGFCEAISSVVIEEGYFDNTPLNGLHFCLLLQWPGEIAEGNGRSQLIIDVTADEKQREAINNIAHGEFTTPGSTHFYVFNSTMSEVLETLYAPIEMSIDIPGGFEYTYAEMENGNSKITAGIQLEFEDSYGQFNILHMNQDGVVRDQIRTWK